MTTIMDYSGTCDRCGAKDVTVMSNGICVPCSASEWRVGYDKLDRVWTYLEQQLPFAESAMMIIEAEDIVITAQSHILEGA